METIKFYFSFRSPYAWLAFHRLERAFAGLPVTVRRIPVFPPPEFPNDPAALPVKLAYIVHDITRIAAAYGLRIKWPKVGGTDWIVPHAAYVFASDCDKGDAFALAAFAARFSEGRNLGDHEVLSDVARACGLDAAATLRASADATFHERVMQGLMEGFGEGIFGVPFFVYGEQKFWGNDRLEWVRRAVCERLGQTVPALDADLMASPAHGPNLPIRHAGDL
ncbi:MAG: DsbA family protein [Deltaproteobacteria bacterium]|nr:DsbA family protein [Deltaproteobacteria bacterium]MBI3390391.1 DsbA family protein [Deltaproteobacteria bacterium]